MLTDVDSDNVNDTSAQTTSTVAVVMTPDIGAETDDDHQVNTTSFTVCRVCTCIAMLNNYHLAVDCRIVSLFSVSRTSNKTLYY